MADLAGLNGNDHHGGDSDMKNNLFSAAAEARSAMPTPPPEPSSPGPSPAVKSTTLPLPPPVALPTSAPPIATKLSNRYSREIPTLDLSGTLNGSIDDPERYAVKSPLMSEPTSASAERRQEGLSPSRSRSGSGSGQKSPSHDRVRRLSAAGMQQLAEEPTSLPVAVVPDTVAIDQLVQDGVPKLTISEQLRSIRQEVLRQPNLVHSSPFTDGGRNPRGYGIDRRPSGPRTLSTPPGADRRTQAQSSPRRNSFNPSARPPPLHLNLNGQPHGARSAPRASSQLRPPQGEQPMPSPVPPSIPLPPMSIPTHLQLEMSMQRPSPLYIHNSHINDIPYESMAVRIERLKNVLLLIGYLERTLCFGALACLDAFLYNFTILPMRFVVAIGVLIRWWIYVVVKEMQWAVSYVWTGIGRLRIRGRRGSIQSQCSECVDSTSADPIPDRGQAKARRSVASNDRGPGPATRQNGGPPDHAQDAKTNGNGHLHPHVHHQQTGRSRHRRTRSLPSNLTSRHKADLLQGGIIILSCLFLMRLDASRMYHVIRGQDAIKLYVIYSVLEVGDRLLSALGQDIFECIISDEALSRNKFGRSKLLLPLGLFLLGLFYTIVHSVVLYFQVISLNVAVNSYSNALLTLLLSNQFVEIKSTVFKRFDKDNLFQLTCADIVERFQIWLMIFIIGMRNVVEVGGLSVPGTGYWDSSKATSTKPLHSPSILPHAFTVLPSWLWSGEVLSPFLIVIGSEILVDFIKHAYINKFNKIRCQFYSRILDILCKDYYTNAFVTPTMTRRVGLAVIPLSCLFIRASVQAYHMFLSAHVPAPILQSTQTSLTAESATPSSPVMLAALDRLDTLLRDALGRAVYGSSSSAEPRSFMSWNTDDVIAAVTMLVVFFIVFLVLLIVKILLGMGLLWFARNRYAAMKEKEYRVSVGQSEPNVYDAKGRRLGGFGHVEVTEDKRRWIHADRDEGLKGKGRPEKPGSKQPEGDYQGVQRWEMVTKRIW